MKHFTLAERKTIIVNAFAMPSLASAFQSEIRKAMFQSHGLSEYYRPRLPESHGSKHEAPIETRFLLAVTTEPFAASKIAALCSSSTDRMYAIGDDLEARGLVKSSTGPRNATPYRLTDAGVAYVASLRRAIGGAV